MPVPWMSTALTTIAFSSLLQEHERFCLDGRYQSKAYIRFSAACLKALSVTQWTPAKYWRRCRSINVSFLKSFIIMVSRQKWKQFVVSLFQKFKRFECNWRISLVYIWMLVKGKNLFQQEKTFNALQYVLKVGPAVKHDSTTFDNCKFYFRNRVTNISKLSVRKCLIIPHSMWLKMNHWKTLNRYKNIHLFFYTRYARDVTDH